MSGPRGGAMAFVCGKHGLRRAAISGGLLALAMLTVPRLAGAGNPPPPPCEKKPPAAPTCPETWNPAAQPSKFTGVPGGWSTAPGTTNQSTPQNPDGFFVLLSESENSIALFDGCTGFGGADDGGTGQLITTVPSGTTVKYTEANGKDPGFKAMAGNNDGGNGQATYIDLHVWGQGDLMVCDATDTSACTCCYVPPPPFTPPQ